MKASDLRIWNLVKYREDLKDMKPERVGKKIEVGADDILFLTEIEGYNECPIEPIPLTEDWLLRFGFEKDGECEHEYTEYYYSKSVIIGQSNHSERIRIILPSNHCEIGDTMDDMMYLLNISIDYVHQLQNLYYCLTGEELKLSNDEKNK